MAASSPKPVRHGVHVWTLSLTSAAMLLSIWSLLYREISMSKCMLVNKDFQTWHLIGWHHSRQPIRSHVRKSLLISMEFTTWILLSNPGPRLLPPECSGFRTRRVDVFLLIRLPIRSRISQATKIIWCGAVVATGILLPVASEINIQNEAKMVQW